MSSTSYIYQPHYNTSCFRVACDDQRGKLHNYIVVTCSPSHNGIWRWPVSKANEMKLGMNGKKACYCVPISECEKLDSLDDLDPKEDEAIIKKIKEQQNKWWKSEVKNRHYTYKNKPEWML